MPALKDYNRFFLLNKGKTFSHANLKALSQLVLLSDCAAGPDASCLERQVIS